MCSAAQGSDQSTLYLPGGGILCLFVLRDYEADRATGHLFMSRGLKLVYLALYGLQLVHLISSHLLFNMQRYGIFSKAQNFAENISHTRTILVLVLKLLTYNLLTFDIQCFSRLRGDEETWGDGRGGEVMQKDFIIIIITIYIIYKYILYIQ